MQPQLLGHVSQGFFEDDPCIIVSDDSVLLGASSGRGTLERPGTIAAYRRSRSADGTPATVVSTGSILASAVDRAPAVVGAAAHQIQVPRRSCCHRHQHFVASHRLGQIARDATLAATRLVLGVFLGNFAGALAGGEPVLLDG